MSVSLVCVCCVQPRENELHSSGPFFEQCRKLLQPLSARSVCVHQTSRGKGRAMWKEAQQLGCNEERLRISQGCKSDGFHAEREMLSGSEAAPRLSSQRQTLVIPLECASKFTLQNRRVVNSSNFQQQDKCQERRLHLKANTAPLCAFNPVVKWDTPKVKNNFVDLRRYLWQKTAR